MVKSFLWNGGRDEKKEKKYNNGKCVVVMVVVCVQISKSLEVDTTSGGSQMARKEEKNWKKEKVDYFKGAAKKFHMCHCHTYLMYV